MKTTTETKTIDISAEKAAIKLGRRLFVVWLALAFLAGMALVAIWPRGLNPSTLVLP